MATLRRLIIPFRSSFLRTSYSHYGCKEGGGCRRCSSIASSEPKVLKFEDQEKLLANANDSLSEEEISKIREEYNAAKEKFLKIPDALKQMPKMNPKGVYVNKNMRLDSIQVYGFDYDYTLAHYSSNLQSLIYDVAKQHLVNEVCFCTFLVVTIPRINLKKEHAGLCFADKVNPLIDCSLIHFVLQFKYPDMCLEFKYDPSFPIRGLYYDKSKGCLMKLDFFGSIELDGCYYGRRKLSREEIDEMYGTRHIGRDQARELVSLMDFFCFSEACLIADIVQHFVDAKLEFDARYVYEDVNRAIQYVHNSGLVHRGILADPARYLVKNDQLLRFLRMLKDKGKKLFLLTNSPFYFVDGGMRFMLQDSLGQQDSWKELFDVVIAKANKPEFYKSDHPFRCYDVEKDTLAFTKVDAFLPGKIYYHGCLKAFLQITKWKGPEVIYFGDHLFSDLRGPSKAGWRTAAIIHELKSEIMIQNDNSYRFEQAKFHIMQELLGRLHATVTSSMTSEAYKSLLRELNEERQKTRYKMKGMFNKSFGATFLTDTGQESAFAYHIHQYADIYTSKPENFLYYPPEAWLHVPYDIKILPHHLKVSSNLFRT
ncbi:uncharacterized protein LOC129891592 isoform X2 [Solanum dulcamara]|uniref:uncharacterized protein LOC129891592 isoform X2 n=1 Tax=Solanum dulcamara TaxID=45834 RepID=UPI0024868FA7|nr:uncharacterized protein LOC129891592 isoform X2 [Solanum dulcamara]